MVALLKRAKKYDEENGEPNCEMDEKMALLRKVALNLARADTTLTASLKGKRKWAAWDNAFIATLK